MEGKIVFLFALFALSYGLPVAQEANQNNQTWKFQILEDIVHKVANRKQPADEELYSLTIEQISDISMNFMLKVLCEVSRIRNATAQMSQRTANIATSSGSQIKGISHDGVLGENQTNDTSDENVNTAEFNNSEDVFVESIDNDIDTDQRRAKRAPKCKYITMYDPRGLPYKTVKVC